VFYVPLSTGNVMDMYKSIAWELGLPTERNRAAAFRQLRTEVSRLTQEGQAAAGADHRRGPPPAQ
jgi:general secretion pathway protein A